MKWFFTVGMWITFAGLMYLFILWVQREAKKIDAENHKPEKMFKLRALK